MPAFYLGHRTSRMTIRSFLVRMVSRRGPGRVLLSSVLLVALVTVGGLMTAVRVSPIVAYSLSCPKLLDGGVVRLLKALWFHQNFDLEKEEYDIVRRATVEEQAEYERRLEELTSAAKDRGRMSQSAFRSLPPSLQNRLHPFQPSFTPQEEALQLLTLEVFLKTCQGHGLTHFAAIGTMLGAFRHHGLVPWDDDIDFMLNASQWREAKKALSSVPGFGLHVHRYYMWKFFPLTNWTEATRAKPWPFVDIFFFAEDAEFVWAHTWGMIGFVMSHKRDIFPLQPRPYSSLQVPVPCGLESIVRRLYDVDTCQTNTYNHRRDVIEYGNIWREPCRLLSSCLPFVSRHSLPGGRLQWEVLAIGDTVLHNVTVLTSQFSCGAHVTQ